MNNSRIIKKRRHKDKINSKLCINLRFTYSFDQKSLERCFYFFLIICKYKRLVCWYQRQFKQAFILICVSIGFNLDIEQLLDVRIKII